MLENMRRIVIFAGNLGSGKTEISINFALFLRQKVRAVSLVDIDIVNPYFRTRIVRDSLGQKGVNVVCPVDELAGADVPALPAAILGVLKNPEVNGVFDVGGDNIGATVLSRFKPYLPGDSYNLFFVVNTSRPFTNDVGGIKEYLHSIEEASRLKVTGLVNNCNLGAQTEIGTIVEGHETVSRAASDLGLPVAFAAAKSDLALELEDRLDVPVLPMDLHMRPPWGNF